MSSRPANSNSRPAISTYLGLEYDLAHNRFSLIGPNQKTIDLNDLDTALGSLHPDVAEAIENDGYSYSSNIDSNPLLREPLPDQPYDETATNTIDVYLDYLNESKADIFIKSVFVAKKSNEWHIFYSNRRKGCATKRSKVPPLVVSFYRFDKKDLLANVELSDDDLNSKVIVNPKATPYNEITMSSAQYLLHDAYRTRNELNESVGVRKKERWTHVTESTQTYGSSPFKIIHFEGNIGFFIKKLVRDHLAPELSFRRQSTRPEPPHVSP